MTRLGITFEEVGKTAENLLAQGENPTIEKIRRHLGTGSNSTIAKYLNDWRASRLIASADHFQAPNVPPDEVAAAVNHVWEKIRNESAAEIKSAREKAQQEIEIAVAKRNHAIAARDQLQQELDNCQKRLNQISTDKELLALDLKSLQQAHLILQERYNNIQEQYDLFKRETDNKILLLESINKKEVEDRKTTLAIMQETHNNALNKLVEINENDRQQRIVEIDAYKVTQQKHEEVVEQLKSINQSIKDKLKEAEATIKIVSNEKDMLKNNCNEKNSMIDNHNILNHTTQLILHEVEHLKNSDNKNEILLTLSHLNESMGKQELSLIAILNLMKETNEMIEE
jgi:hypothetical protein